MRLHCGRSTQPQGNGQPHDQSSLYIHRYCRYPSRPGKDDTMSAPASKKKFPGMEILRDLIPLNAPDNDRFSVRRN